MALIVGEGELALVVGGQSVAVVAHEVVAHQWRHRLHQVLLAASLYVVVDEGVKRVYVVKEVVAVVLVAYCTLKEEVNELRCAEVVTCVRSKLKFLLTCC